MSRKSRDKWGDKKDEINQGFRGVKKTIFSLFD
jgi:hypothetical protein